LVATAATIASGRYLSGRKLEPAPRFFIGAVESPGVPPHAQRVERALKKVSAGARFLQLQICFEKHQLEAFFERAVADGLASEAALLPSICLARSPNALRFIDANVPGVVVPHELIERCER